MKYQEILEQVISEINMSPSSLKGLARGIEATAGMEFELILPNVGNLDDDDGGPDYDQDERAYSWSQIEDFFTSGDMGNGLREVQRAISRLQEEFYEHLDELVYEEWNANEREFVYDWIVNNISPDEVGEELELEPNEDGDYDISPEQWDEFIERQIDSRSSYYDDAQEAGLDEIRGDIYGSTEERDWLRNNYPYMSDIESETGLTWPHWSYNESGADIESIADQFGDAIGKSVNWSSSYHGARRTSDGYVVEPDSSLEGDDDNDSGLEFVSHPMPIDEMFSDLDKIVAWAKRTGAYTNSSTGLHMNVSIPGLSTAKLDYVKLALLLGDEYVLQQFERLSNSYTKSAMQIIKRRVEERPEDVEAMLKQMKNHLDDIATKVIHSGETNKFTSINTKDSYVEFRSPGGDWLSGDIEKVKNTMLRFVVALDAAADPQKYRQEYLKKLYLVLKPKSQGDAIEAFAKYAAGEFNRSDLKLMIQQIRKGREAKKNPTAQPNNSVYTPPATGGEWSGQWLILDKNDNIIHRFGGIGNQQADANRIAIAWLRAHPENMQDGVTVVPEMK